MKPSQCRKTSLAGIAVNFNDGSSIFVTVVIYAVNPAEAEAAIRSWTASTRSAYLAHRDARQLYRRVFVPSFELMREGLPPPDV